MVNEDGVVAVTSYKEIFCSENDRILAELAVKNKFLSEEQIREALSFQHHEKDLGRSVSLGDVLIEKAMLSPKHSDVLKKAVTFLTLRQPDRVFARLAIRNRFSTQEQVGWAMDYQAKLFKQTGIFRSLGDLLVDQGAITTQQRNAIASALDRLESKKDAGKVTSREGPGFETISRPETVHTEASGSEARVREHKGSEVVVVQDQHFDLLLSDDRLNVYLRLKGEVPEAIDAKHIKSLLESRGIIYGLVEDALLEQFLRNKPDETRLWQVARGMPFKPGKSAEVRYFFDTATAGAGENSEADSLSLKEIGRIAQVRQGDLIAEKIPGITPEDGIDVYGEPIAGEEHTNVNFLCGPGVELSEDGLKAFAKVSGNPRISPFGKLSVLPELIIEGDVSFETGNISFDGDITVRGVVQDGFRVKGAGLRALEIAKAHVDVGGDVIVFGGILGANIRSQGSIKAVHVHASRIEALGDLVVERGIVESRITLSGRCISSRGKILSSNIVARQGIEALQIGSERSRPCSLLVGVDPLAEKEMEKLKESASLKLKNKEKYEKIIEKLDAEASQIEQKIGELAQLQDRSLREQRTLTGMMQELKKVNDLIQISRTESMLRELESTMRSSEDELEKLFARQDQAKERISTYRVKIEEIEKELEAIQDELSAMNNWSSGNESRPVVRVYDTVFSGTVMKGPLSSLILKDNMRRVVIKETKATDAESESGSALRAKMNIYNL